jgi:hypothetical protein
LCAARNFLRGGGTTSWCSKCLANAAFAQWLQEMWSHKDRQIAQILTEGA